MDFELRTQNLRVNGVQKKIQYIVCLPLEKIGFQNSFSTRKEGFSPLPFNSLNLAYLNDSPEIVNKNRTLFLKALNRERIPIATVKQVHSNQCHIIPDLSLPFNEVEADAIAGLVPGVFAGVKTADCLGLLMADPKTGVYAAVHAGWKGTLKKITENTLNTLKEIFHGNPSHLRVGMGPAACGSCYEVGEEVAQSFKREFPEWPSFLKKKEGSNKYLFDCSLANKGQLLKMGVPEKNIYISKYCTIHQNDLFFSYRREEGTDKNKITGRQLALIGKFS